MKFEKQNRLLKLLKAASNANRLKILQILAEVKTPINVTALVDRVGVSQATLSNHLATMRSAGVISAKQDGQNMFYSIKDEAIVKLLKILD